MTLDIEPDVTFPQGDKRRIQFQLLDDEGQELNITDYDFKWVLENTRTREEVLSLDTSSHVSIDARDNDFGKIDILLETGATSDLAPSDYREVLQATDNNGDQTTWVGRVVLTEGL